MINALQIMVLAVLFNILFPVNAKVISFEILKACSFDFYQTDTIFAELFGFTETESFSDAFEEAGYEGSNFVMGMGISLLFVVSFPFYILFHKASVYVCADDVEMECLKSWVKPKQFLVMGTVFLAESCVDLGFWCGICLKFMDEDRWSTEYEIASSILVFFFVVCLIITPLYLLIIGILLHKAVKRKDEAAIEKYQEIFEGKRFKSLLAI